MHENSCGGHTGRIILKLGQNALRLLSTLFCGLSSGLTALFLSVLMEKKLKCLLSFYFKVRKIESIEVMMQTFLLIFFLLCSVILFFG